MDDHVFISYSHRDQDYALMLTDYLRQHGFNVWLDERIDYGEDWWHSIVGAIRECGAFLVIMTPASDQSKWVQREVTFADSLDKPAFPVLLQGELLSSKNWLIYIRTQYVDVRNGELPDSSFCDRLAQYCKRSKGESKLNNTGQKAPYTGRYQFARYGDGTTLPLPKAEERIITLSQGETFPPVRSSGKGSWWQYID
ncbi:MAG: YjzC family protein [Anaerolineae bacterium]|nr:YjzC family protein [Anaerolineae bacterium]